MSIIPQAFHFHLQKLSKTEKFLVAYSGGVDSHVLLHLCSQLKNSPSGFEQSFSAVYIDHGLSQHSNKWGKHCQHICFELDIPLTIIEVDARPKNGQSPEASARTARYQAFSQLLRNNECLLTAQHLDDQAETLLLQLLRGSGTKGLSAMPRVKPFSKGYLCRPILDYKKQDILDYARQHQLQWIEDESNQQQRFDRNYLRQTILPLLEERWPAVKENFAKSAEVLAESQLLLDDIADSDLQSLFFVNHNGDIEYDKILLEPTVKLLDANDDNNLECRHDQARLNNLLRQWIHINHLPMPSKKILEQIVKTVLLAGEDAMPLVSWKRDAIRCEIRRYQNKLYLLDVSMSYQNPVNSMSSQKDKTVPAADITLMQNQTVFLNKTNTYLRLSSTVEKGINKGFDRQMLISKTINVRFRQGGERYRQTPDSHSRLLKHWFQKQSIPPWEREHMPLIYWGDELIQVGHHIVNFSLINEGSGDRLRIIWQRTEELHENKLNSR